MGWIAAAGQANFSIAFGSCNKQNLEQPLWEDIANENPNLWIWLGDNIYGDTQNMQTLAARYREQKTHPAYAKFAQNVPVIGTWDDHDYGENDGDKTYPQKVASRDLALAFLGVPKSNPVWKRQGLYQSYVYRWDSITVRVLLLDTRYFKDPIEKTRRGYVADTTADLLGAAQWQWLEAELAEEEDLLIVANGTQVIPEDHPYEKWANYPKSRARLLSLLEKDDTKRIVLLSGDRHIGEISKLQLGNKTIHEVTSSGMTHSWENVGEEKNRHRVGNIVSQKNYGLLTWQDGELLLQIKGEDGKVYEVVK